jgi:hypothetical protein
MTIQTESGISNTRIEYVPENGDQGVTPADPAWRIASMRYTNFEAEMGPEDVEKPALGEVVSDVSAGLEENEITVEYDMQKWFVDSNGNPQDIAAYGILRSANRLVDSLTLVERIDAGSVAEDVTLQPGSTVEAWYNGTDEANVTRKASRVYTVGKGCDVTEVTVTGDPEEVFWHIEATLMAEEARSFQIDQPPSATELVVKSTDASDTGLYVAIENEGASTTETVQLDGTDATNLVSTTETFADVDAAEVQDADGNVVDHDGDIVVAINSGSVSTPNEGEALTALYGRNEYGNTHGDGGVPVTGAGSHASDLTDDYYFVANAFVERPAGEPFEAVGNVGEMELTFENDVETGAQQETRSPLQHHGNLVPELAVTIDGETTTHQRIQQRMASSEDDALMHFNRAESETITLPRSKVTSSPRNREAGSATGEPEITLRGQEVPEITNASS